MRRKECERDEAFAWEVLKNSVYSTVSMVHPDGTPYATPVNIVGDEVYKTLYFHCAGAGERWEILKDGALVCVTVVSNATLIPNGFTTDYRSAMFKGRAEVVTDEGEKIKAMLLLCTAVAPKAMGRFDEAMAHCPAKVIKIVPEVITGKEHEMHQAPKAHGCKGE